ncbi:glutathione S-transferase [Rhodobacterales bacterium HKCCE2091]|nr:glutathione S-transferase [Rhodobacterales bacterium HKCCE2091]
MLTLYYAPRSRASRMYEMMAEMDLLDEIDLRIIDIPRADGSGGRDPGNPHPEGKVPLLVHEGVEIRETNAIMLYLTDFYPERGFGAAIGTRERGKYLSLLAYYGNVMEPVYVAMVAGMLDNQVVRTTFRGIPEVVSVLDTALGEAPFLLGDRFTAADLLLSSPYHWFPDATPAEPAVRDWVARCADRPAHREMLAFDAGLVDG